MILSKLSNESRGAKQTVFFGDRWNSSEKWIWQILAVQFWVSDDQK